MNVRKNNVISYAVPQQINTLGSFFKVINGLLKALHRVDINILVKLVLSKAKFQTNYKITKICRLGNQENTWKRLSKVLNKP